MLLEDLGFVASADIVKPLPWRLVSNLVPTIAHLLTPLLPTSQSLTSKRRTETTRPIFWSNRQRSYLSRTADWDEVSYFKRSLLLTLPDVFSFRFSRSSLTAVGEIKPRPLSVILTLSPSLFPSLPKMPLSSGDSRRRTRISPRSLLVSVEAI